MKVTFVERVLAALSRDDDTYRPAHRRPSAAFWRDLLSALRRDTPAFTGGRDPGARPPRS